MNKAYDGIIEGFREYAISKNDSKLLDIIDEETKRKMKMKNETPHFGQIRVLKSTLKQIVSLDYSDYIARLFILCQNNYEKPKYDMYLTLLAAKLCELDKYVYLDKDNQYCKLPKEYYSKYLFNGWAEDEEEYKFRNDCDDYKEKYREYKLIQDVASHILAVCHELVYIPEWAALIDSIIKIKGNAKVEELLDNDFDFVPVLKRGNNKLSLFDGEVHKKYFENTWN